MEKPVIRGLRRGVMALAVVGGVASLGAGCLTRPVTQREPSLKQNFTSQVRPQAVDKVDLLFAIDNSASMGDKQELLAQAVPDLVNRLVRPNCIDETGKVLGQTGADGKCAAGKAEFPAVHDMHIGIVSSSLGGRGSDACAATAKNPVDATLDRHNDDSGHLIARGGAKEVAVAQAGTSNFLAWLPKDEPKNAGKPDPPNGVQPLGPDPATLAGPFSDMVRGVHEYGCGFEAQLESWYRFLIQPDPYAKIVLDNGRALLDGVDDTILKQRKDFLRPDSLVAIVMVTDENDSTVDPLAISGQAWVYENSSFPKSPTTKAPKGTQACQTDPNSPDCTSCAFKPTDPGCSPDTHYKDPDDNLNQRFFHMKQRFGLDPQFPIKRYINALTSFQVPNRDGEHPPSNGKPSGNYIGNNNCTNPLFAANLPSAGDQDTCKLARGPRSPDLVFFAVIGGVPWQLLTEDPANPGAAKFKSSLTSADYTRILGKDPLNYDFSEADPHMLESLVPRQGAGLIQPGSAANYDTSKVPFNGREWTTGLGDLQYACIFKLPSSKDCNLPQFSNACDCDGVKDSPLCDPTNKKLQVYGKAYPTIREFEVVRKLGDQGIMASLCPRTLDQGSEDYGYRPAVRSIIDRLKNALTTQCLPQPLTKHNDGKVSCLILLTLAQEGDQAACNGNGLKPPDAQVLAKFREAQTEEWKLAGGADAGLTDPKKQPVCELDQLVVNPNESCESSPNAGWCYVTGTAAGRCPQAILFSANGVPTGAKISLQCIEEKSGEDAGAAK